MPDLKVSVGPLKLKNPVVLASGTFSPELGRYFRPARVGGVVTKSVTLEPRAGNLPPRLVETTAGVINSIGLENPGLKIFCREYLPWLQKQKTTRIVSIAGETAKEFKQIASVLDRKKGIDALELNISCPNIAKGGLTIGVSGTATKEVVRKVRRATRRPLIVKLSPNVTDIVKIARSAVAGGADIISLVNTFRALAVNWRTGQPLLGNVTGGLSGPAIKPMALWLVARVAQAVEVPVMGIGGIMTAEDVLEFMAVGARAVQIGTATLVDPAAPVKIVKDLEKLLAREKIRSITKR
ncbi:MAG: dihydroorotate dehydrogenase [Planctomycetes bacterium]|nr:dihydroorotate dehydrogenase [Planctomycetota bacterium]